MYHVDYYRNCLLDISLFSSSTFSAGDKFNDFMVTNVIVNSDGLVLWLYPALIKTYCTLNVKYFPFDSQHCNITFISWTFSGYELDIVYNESFANTVYYIPENQEWRVDPVIDAHKKVEVRVYVTISLFF